MKFLLKILFSIIFVSIIYLFGFNNPSYALRPGCEDPINLSVDYFLRNCMEDYDVFTNDPGGTAAALATRINAAIAGEGNVYWYAQVNSDGSVTLVCSNNSIHIRFYGPPPPAPPQEPPPPPPTAVPPTSVPPTLPPACNAQCTSNVYCKAGNDGCDSCIIPVGATKGTCQATPPTPTPAPACNSQCTSDVYCSSGDTVCDICVKPTGSTTGTCQARPTPTFTPTPTASPTPIPPTPTPTFNPGNCQCVPNLEYANLKTGQTTTITGRAKILGSDSLRGRITSQNFFLQEGADSTGGTIIATSGLLPATKLSGTSPIQYESKWTFTMPKLVSGKTYKIFRNISCQANDAAFTSSEVAGVTTSQTQQPTSLLSKLITFVRGVFGVKEEKNIAVASIPTKSPDVLAVQTASLQLGTINPIEVYQKTCSVIKFRYNF